MSDVLQGLYDVVLERRETPLEGSYTCYLFSQGLDKILKKCGEECAETIIAAKNGDKQDTINELCDLTYHLMVLMAEQGITPDELSEVLEERRKKLKNLKTPHRSDKES